MIPHLRQCSRVSRLIDNEQYGLTMFCSMVCHCMSHWRSANVIMLSCYHVYVIMRFSNMLNGQRGDTAVHTLRSSSNINSAYFDRSDNMTLRHIASYCIILNCSSCARPIAIDRTRIWPCLAIRKGLPFLFVEEPRLSGSIFLPNFFPSQTARS